MDRNLIAVFDSREEAEAAREDLLALGVAGAAIHLRAGTTADLKEDESDRPAYSTDGDSGRRIGFFARLFGLDDELSGQYSEAVRRGSIVLAVDAIREDQVEAASRIFEEHAAIDMDERVAGWRERGWSRFDGGAEPMSDEELASERELCQRTMRRGGARVFERQR